jgi:predicted aspartyl protease
MRLHGLRRLSLCVLATALCGASLTQPVPTGHGIATAQDRFARLTIPVMVNGSGPYAFVVDTGADRSVISRELADALKLPAGPTIAVHDTAGLQRTATVLIDRLGVDTREIGSIEAPVVPATDLGAQGMLGLDTMRDRRVVMDFIADRFFSAQADTVLDAPGTIIVEGRRRFGQMVLIDSESRGTPIFVILDSGAQNTIGNIALRHLMAQDRADATGRHSGDIISVTGKHTLAGLNEIPELRLGSILLSHVPIAYADLHTFAQFHLLDQPAMLLGMDALRMFARVTVDFRAREASFITR